MYVLLFVFNSHLHTFDSEIVTASAASLGMLYSSQMFLLLIKNENGKTTCILPHGLQNRMLQDTFFVAFSLTHQGHRLVCFYPFNRIRYSSAYKVHRTGNINLNKSVLVSLYHVDAPFYTNINYVFRREQKRYN